MSIRLPLIPFNPTDVGPLELLQAKIGDAKRFLKANIAWVVLASIVLIPSALYFEISLPEIPDWVIVGIGAGVFAAPWTVFLGIKVAQGIYRRDHEILSVQNAKNGNQRLVRLSPEKFENMRVKNQNDDWRDLDFLHTVYINGSRCYEVDAFNGEENVAVASWQAGATNSEMRREKARISEIKTDLEKQADKTHTILANYTSHVRGQVGEIANELVFVAQDVDLPGHETEDLHERLSETLAENDPTDDLVTGFEEQARDDDQDGDDDADEVDVEGDRKQTPGEKVSDGMADIFERAQRLQDADGEAEARPDGGRDR